MRYAFYRLTAPILDRIPDISHQPQSRQVSIGLAASLLFHLLLLLFALLVGHLLPGHSLVSFPKAKPKLQEIELTIIPPALAEEVRLVPLEESEHPRPFLDSTGLASAAQAPDKPLFESDADMIGASDLPALGALPLPSQLGRVAPEFPVFENQKMSLGKAATPFSQSTPPPPATTAPPAESMPPKNAVDAAPSPPTDAPPAEEVKPPSPMKEVAKASEDEIAVAARAASPPEAAPQPMPRMRATLPVAMLNTPPPPPPSTESDDRALLEKTRIEGNITNRGRNAVDAADTPMGRYQKGVQLALGSRWRFYVTDSARGAPFAPGSVRVSFTIDRKGKVSNVKTEGNTSNSAYAFTSERAVLDSQFPPPPTSLFDVLPNGQLDLTYTFTVYSP